MEKSVNEVMSWMNSKMLAQSKLSIAQDPAVKVTEIIQKIRVSETVSGAKKKSHHKPCVVIDCMYFLPAGNGGDLQSCGKQT